MGGIFLIRFNGRGAATGLMNAHRTMPFQNVLPDERFPRWSEHPKGGPGIDMRNGPYFSLYRSGGAASDRKASRSVICRMYSWGSKLLEGLSN